MAEKLAEEKPAEEETEGGEAEVEKRAEELELAG